MTANIPLVDLKHHRLFRLKLSQSQMIPKLRAAGLKNNDKSIVSKIESGQWTPKDIVMMQRIGIAYELPYDKILQFQQPGTGCQISPPNEIKASSRQVAVSDVTHTTPPIGAADSNPVSGFSNQDKK